MRRGSFRKKDFCVVEFVPVRSMGIGLLAEQIIKYQRTQSVSIPIPNGIYDRIKTRFLQEGIQKETVPEFEAEPRTLLPGNFKILTLLPFWGLHVIWCHGSIFSGFNVIGKHSALAVSIYALFFVENPAKIFNIFFSIFSPSRVHSASDA